MANFTLFFTLLNFFVLLLSFNFGATLARDVPAGMKSWCVAKSSENDTILQKNIDYACIEQGIDCKIIEEGGACYEPNTLLSHASVVMNLYYQKHHHLRHACSFSGSAVVVLTDPSYGNCLYSYNQQAAKKN